MRPHAPVLVLACLLALMLAAVPAPAATKAKKVRLRAFSTCTKLIEYGNRHVGRVEPMRFPPVGLPAPMPEGDVVAGRPAAPAPAAGGTGGGESAQDFSTTNVQEAGVDEPDIVKTDGKRIFAMAGGRLHAVDVSGPSPRLAGSLTLPEEGFDHRLLLHGDTLLVAYLVATPPPPSSPPSDTPTAAPASSIAVRPTATRLAQVDVRDLAAMRVVRTLDVDGQLVDARLHRAVARVVLSTQPPAMQPIPVAEGADQRARGSRRANHWLPRGTFRTVRTGRTKRRALNACRATRHPASFSGLGMLTILTIDLEKGLEPVDSDSLMSDAETVYASAGSLYVATRRWTPATTDPNGGRIPENATTTIHRFDISEPAKTAYTSSGDVPGYLLSQWAMSERGGVLRVASTSTPAWFAGVPEGTPSQSYVTTLRERSGVLDLVGSLGGLGKGERIYAVRFIDDVGYVVTFRQTDPLYTVDVSDPARPAVVGELKILGYSAYLHPAGDGLLIGVGQDATEEGRTTGAQISLFDVSNARTPTRLHQQTLGRYSSTEAENDHHAFLYWPASELAVIPLSSYDDRAAPFAGAVGFRVSRAAGIAEVGRIQHQAPGPPPVRRSLVVGSRLFTLSEAGLKASALDTLGDAAWVPFPAP